MSLLNAIRAAQIDAGERVVLQSLHDRGLCTPEMCPMCRAAADPGKGWIALADQMPPEKKLVLVKGPSGYMQYTEFQISAYYNSEFRPPLADGRVRWLDPCGNELTDAGWVPTHWRELL